MDVMTTAEVCELDEAAPAPRPTCASIYAEHFEFVWRNACRMGVASSSIEDVVQEVFVVVQRRLAEFEGRSSVRTWLYGILARVTMEQRRRDRQRTTKESAAAAELARDVGEQATDVIARREAARVLEQILDEMDEDKRTMFVLVDLEDLSVPEAARGLEINLNTAYARLRAARAHFAESVKRLHAQRSNDEKRVWWRRS
jgi:RNA polymerase sigma-70 factor (ECF subfamily)